MKFLKAGIWYPQWLVSDHLAKSAPLLSLRISLADLVRKKLIRRKSKGVKLMVTWETLVNEALALDAEERLRGGLS